MPWDDERARAQVARTEELLSGLESLPDGPAATRAAETVEALVDLYGDCLARITARLGEGGGAGLLRRLAEDELVGHLLLVHDLHPDPVETRVRRALEDVRSRQGPAAGEVELLELSETAARVRLRGGRGCSASPRALADAVREAVAGLAPEIERVDVETAPAQAPTALVPVDSLFRRSARAAETGG
ncbi:NifU family protein [Streptomyces macrosporus]|uniref:NifU family protein n=1 Tax=Streptomyces macrosporus TaxID=44032 RepID=A0ABP5X6I6_9ACTN